MNGFTPPHLLTLQKDPAVQHILQISIDFLKAVGGGEASIMTFQLPLKEGSGGKREMKNGMQEISR